MNFNDLVELRYELERFSARLDASIDLAVSEKYGAAGPIIATMKRSSLDLTRALAKMRQAKRG